MNVDTSAGTGAADTSATAATSTATTTTTGSAAPAAGDTAATTSTDGTAAATDPNAATAAAPDAYTFTAPEGVTLDQAAVDRFTPLFKEAGLSQDAAQKLVDAYAAHLAEQAAGSSAQLEQWYADRRAAEVATANESGLAALKADKELGGAHFDTVHARVTTAIGAVGTPEMRQAFDQLGLGNHPEMVRLVNRLIDYRPDDPGHQAGGGGAVGSEKSAAQKLYPDLA